MWHEMLLSFDKQLEAIVSYRWHESAMQIVSGRLARPVVHFKAPQSEQVLDEMARYVDWFNRVHARWQTPIHALLAEA